MIVHNFNMLKNILASRLKELRLKSKLTQISISTEMKIPPRLYQYYESEKNKRLPSCETLIKISNYHNVSIDYLLGQSNNPETNK